MARSLAVPWTASLPDYRAGEKKDRADDRRNRAERRPSFADGKERAVLQRLEQLSCEIAGGRHKLPIAAGLSLPPLPCARKTPYSWTLQTDSFPSDRRHLALVVRHSRTLSFTRQMPPVAE